MRLDRLPRRAGLLAAFAATTVVTLSVTSYATTGNPHPMNVLVTNGPERPLPVAGSVGVSGGVSVVNTPNVRLAGPVQVGGPVTAVRGEPYQVTDRVSLFGEVRISLSEQYTVPAGKDLVVTFVTVRAGNFGGAPGTAGEPFEVTLTTAEGPGIQVFLPLQRQGTHDRWSAALPLDVRFVDRWFLAAQRVGGSGQLLQFDYTVSGYLVDEPAP